MKQTLIFLCSMALTGVYAQGSVSNGALSANNLIHSVGELYVVPANPNEASSGTIGAVSRIEFFALGIDEVTALNGIKVYPNPTANSVFFESTEPVTQIEIYDIGGRLVASQKVDNNKTDLSMLQSGTYIIRINNKNKQSFKIIKK
jgi:hypothetical protein